MSDILVRNLEESTVMALKKLAAKHNCSLQVEVKNILDSAANRAIHDPAKLAAKIRKKLSSGKHSDSAKLTAKDRER